ncbi:MAG: DUF2202 domain-containing protein [Verrucomicrobiales bacterium]|nr:DUF2202 domain-containing protein [Verrucomicrobiales bacterium]
MKPWIKNSFVWLTAGVTSLTATLPSLALTPSEANSILYMKQEEKMARDLYTALADQWDARTLQNIAAAEQRHMNAIDTLIAGNGLQDSTPAEPGKFSIPDLQSLYNELLAKGQASLAGAFAVGVAVEETDIADLKEAIAATTDTATLRVFGNLLRGSTHHLAAFNTAVTSGDAAAAVGACSNGGRGGQGSCAAASAGACPNGKSKGHGPRMGGQGPCTDSASCPNASTCPSPTTAPNGKGQGSAPIATPSNASPRGRR